MKRALYLFMLFLVSACNESAESKLSSPKSQFDFIDGITGVNNWKWINGSDTSYLYFSRVGDQKMNVYHFWINKGDSVNCQLNSIEPVGDTVAWNWGAEKWFLFAADSSSMKWKENGSAAEFTFQKIDSSRMLLTSGQGDDTLVKTLPLSTFLVRAKYDYEHNTAQVDSGLIPSKQLRK